MRASWMAGLVFLLLPGCAQAPPPAPVAKAKTLLGSAVTLPVTPLGDVAKDPAAYAGKTFATTGKVSAVCQAMGCWMEIGDLSGDAHVRMHGHAFFIPKDASGRQAKVEATLVTQDPKECDEEAEKQMGKKVARLELDATGVELE